MAMAEQVRHCSSGVTKTLSFALRFLAMAMAEQARHCSSDLTKTFSLGAGKRLRKVKKEECTLRFSRALSMTENVCGDGCKSRILMTVCYVGFRTE